MATNMSMIVARMQKMKAGNLTGMQKHNQREFSNHSNENIDSEREHLNYDLVNPEHVNYQEKVTEIIDSQRESTKTVRKDAVLVNEWIITSNQEFFKGLDKEQTERFFESSLSYFSEKFGSQNMAYAQVHLDEATPHMHLGIVPMTKDGRLSGKTIFNRQTLREIQEEFPSLLQEKGFDIQRGMEGSERKNLSVQTYKRVVTEAKKEAEKEIEDIIKEVEIFSKPQVELKHLKEQTGRRGLLRKEIVKYELTKEQFKKMEHLAVAGIKKQYAVQNTLIANQEKIQELELGNRSLETNVKELDEQLSGTLTEIKRKDSSFEKLYGENFILESRLEDRGIPVPIITDLEREGRIILSKLERGFEPETRSECQNWLSVLEKNKEEGYIQKTRIQIFLDKLKVILNKFLRHDKQQEKPEFSMDWIKSKNEQVQKINSKKSLLTRDGDRNIKHRGR